MRDYIVLCYNGTVFPASEDFSVLMYAPSLPVNGITHTATPSSTIKRQRVRRVAALKSNNSRSEIPLTGLLIGGILVVLLLVAISTVYYAKRSSILSTKRMGKQTSTAQEVSDYSADLETIVNTVIGMSKHAAFLVANSNLSGIKKLASGGGGEIFLTQVMNPFLNEKSGTRVIQKVVFIKSSKSKEAFDQEVGIMIMLSTFLTSAELSAIPKIQLQ